MSTRHLALAFAVALVPVVASAQSTAITELESVDVRVSTTLGTELRAAREAMLVGDFRSAEKEYAQVAQGIDDWAGDSAPYWLLAERAAYARHAMGNALDDARRAEYAAGRSGIVAEEAQATLDQYNLAAASFDVRRQFELRGRLRDFLAQGKVGGALAASIAQVVQPTD